MLMGLREFRIILNGGRMDGQIFSLHFHSSREEGTGCVVLYGLMPPCPLSECEIKRVRLGSLNGWIG